MMKEEKITFDFKDPKAFLSQSFPREMVEEEGGYPMGDCLFATIGGVRYRVHSHYVGDSQMGDVLDLATMERINRTA